MNDYSQYGEQRVILDYFNGKVGTFLDIGANDGITFSNTQALAHKGWDGVLVEPSPKAFAALDSLYRERLAVLVNAAITTTDGPITLHEGSDTLLSSLDADQGKVWKAHTFAPITVEGITFATLLERTKRSAFDFVNIDAEGHDLDILRQMDLDALVVQMLCIEHGGRQEEIRAYCKGFREVLHNGVNLIMAR
jgi:FkbM family methyltransferase